MALSRCLEHHSPPHSSRYISYALPVGYPNSSTICGRENCRNQGVVWLRDDERNSYLNGERIFSFDSNVTGVRVDYSGLKKIV